MCHVCELKTSISVICIAMHCLSMTFVSLESVFVSLIAFLLNSVSVICSCRLLLMGRTIILGLLMG